MTIPIRPGPFSFLASAGQAAGSIGEALQSRQERQRQQALQNAGLLMQLISGPNATVDPTTIAPQVVSALQGLGIQGITPQAVVQNPTIERQKAISALPAGPRKELAQGIPTEAQAAVDTAAGAEANVTTQALQGLTIDQIRNLKHVMTPEAAKLADTVTLEKMKTELLAQDPQRIESQVQSEIRKDVLKRLPRSPIFAKVADYAAVGGLGYLLQDLENQGRIGAEGRAQNTEKIKLVTAVTSQSANAYRQARAQWEAGLKQARQDALGIAGATGQLSQEEVTKKLNEVDKDYLARNPMPTYGDFLNQLLDESGLSKGDYEEAFRSLAHAPGGAQPSDPLQTVIQMYKSGQLTDADIDASQKLTPAQKAQIKASKRSTP